MPYKNYVLIVLFLLAVAGISLFARRSQAPEIQPLQPPLIKEGELVLPDKGEDKGVLEKEVTPIVAPTYKELTTAGHKLYLQEKYAEALPYFKKAVMLEQSDRIYRSLYSVYLGLKDYANAEINIKKAVSINRGIPNNWLEYASFENYYQKASFEAVSLIYLEGLKATKDHIDLITSYAGYLVENNKYAEAIVYLEKAIVLDPARKNIFKAEITSLQKN